MSKRITLREGAMMLLEDDRFKKLSREQGTFLEFVVSTEKRVAEKNENLFRSIPPGYIAAVESIKGAIVEREFPIYVKIIPRDLRDDSLFADDFNCLDWNSCEVDEKAFMVWLDLTTHGNAFRFENRRVILKEKARWLIENRPDECKGARGGITIGKLWTALNRYSEELFKAKKPPLEFSAARPILSEVKNELCK